MRRAKKKQNREMNVILLLCRRNCVPLIALCAKHQFILELNDDEQTVSSCSNICMFTFCAYWMKFYSSMCFCGTPVWTQNLSTLLDLYHLKCDIRWNRIEDATVENVRIVDEQDIQHLRRTENHTICTIFKHCWNQINWRTLLSF